MERTSKEDLKKYFETGDIPTQEHYAELIDALRHEDGNVPIADVDGLQDLLDSKATTNALLNHINDNTVHESLNLTGAEIKVAYEAEADTNAFTDLEQQQVADGITHRADSQIHVSTNDRTNWNNKFKQYQANETYTDGMGDIIRIYKGDIVMFNNSRPFTSTDIDLEMSQGSWTKLVAGAHTPEIVLVTPLIVQRDALLTMVVKAKFLDSTSVLSIDGMTTVSQSLDLLNDQISIQFNSPSTLGYHNVRVSNKAGQVIHTQQLQVADDLEIIPITTDWRLEGEYASEITVDNNRLYPNVEIIRGNNGNRSAFFEKDINGAPAIPENQNFELHFSFFTPIGYTLSRVTTFGVKPYGTANLGATIGYSLNGYSTTTATGYEYGTHRGDYTITEGDVFVIKRVNGVIRYYSFDGVNLTLLATNNAADNSAMEIFCHLWRVGGVENIKLIYNY